MIDCDEELLIGCAITILILAIVVAVLAFNTDKRLDRIEKHLGIEETE